MGTPSLLVHKITSYFLVPTFQRFFEFVVQSQGLICPLSSSSLTMSLSGKMFCSLEQKLEADILKCYIKVEEVPSA